MSAKAQVVGSVVAGFPSPAEQYVEPQLDLNAYLIKRKAATFLMYVDGDSMRDAAILDGDLIVVFPDPTDATNEMLSAIAGEVSALFIPGERYRKSGVVFFGLEKAGTARQLDLFSETRALEKSKLYAVIDRLNGQYGKGAVGSASEGLRCRAPLWRMRRDKLSGVSTTDWRHLPRVK